MDLLNRVRNFIQRHDLLTEGDRVVVGVSGGPDSLSLLHLLHHLEEYRLQLHVAHLHHSTRGEASDADAAFVADLARRWGLPATITRRDVPAIADRRDLAFEEAARRVRYSFLAHVAGEFGATKVAVGHNGDDQAETVLMHFLRGAGPAGLRGMRPATSLSDFRLLEGDSSFPLPSLPLLLIRPLLDVSRAEVEAYCAEQGLEPRFDRSNLDTTYFRNRLRHELIPELETYNPNVRARLRHTAEVIAADYDLLERLRDWAWDGVVIEESEEAVVFDRVAWEAKHLSIRRALIRRAAYRLRPQLRDVTFVHVENAVRVAQRGDSGAQATLPAGLMLTVGYQRLTVADEGYERPLEGPELEPDQEVAVALPGDTALPDGDWILEAELLDRWSQAQVETNLDRWTAYLDADALEAPLILRTRRTGDHFKPHGMGGHAPRLTDWMTNAKIPRPWRDRLPLLTAAEEIVWVCGWRVSESALVGPKTQRVARLRFLKR